MTNLDAAAVGLDDAWDILVGDFREPGDPLPEPWASVIGPWDIPQLTNRPYVYVNFMLSRDGRATFNEPDIISPGLLALGKGHDPWLMGVLRARADAVMVGDGTLRANPDHIWTSEYIYPAATSSFAELRRAENLAEKVPLVLVSFDADLPSSAAQFQYADGHTILATTARGEAQARALAAEAAGQVDVEVVGEESVDLAELLHRLHEKYGIRRLLCEGGPRLYAGLLADRLVDDEFLTLSPVIMGAAPTATRPSLVEGIAFRPENAPVSRLLSVARSGDFLFLRSRYSDIG